MDQKEFNKLQAAVQWAVDEGQIATNLAHNQDVWGQGVVEGREPLAAENWANTTFRVVCPTACCLAGNIVLAEGDQFVVPSQTYKPGQVVNADYCIDRQGVIHSIPGRAMDLIGVDTDRDTFDGEQDIDVVVERAKDLAAYHGFDLTVA